MSNTIQTSQIAGQTDSSMSAAPIRGLVDQCHPTRRALDLGVQRGGRDGHPFCLQARLRRRRGPRTTQAPIRALSIPRLSRREFRPVSEREPTPPLRFAQLVGFIFIAGVAGFAFGLPLLGVTATGFALFAAFLNAAFGICLGCQIYPR